MADQVNTNVAMFSANTFNVKAEQCQEEDSFVEDKVCISETSITIDNATKLQGPIWHGKIKQCEESTCLDTVKTELASVEVIEAQNDNIKIESGISADDIKIEFNNELLYCEHCEAYYADYCSECGMLMHILNKHALDNADSGAPDDIPNDILEIQDCFGQTGIYALRIIPAGVKFGPFTGLSATECPWTMEGVKFVLDKNKLTYLNWMQYINPTTKTSDQNLHIFQCDDNIYYQSTRQIQAGDELLVYIGEEYGSIQNNIFRVDFATTTKDIIKNTFACTFCCLGFSSTVHLAKHKTVCVTNAAGKFSIEELMQCPSCKIHLDSKEYYEHHTAFCCERNARKGIPLTPSAKRSRTALNERKRRLREVYKCEQCKYRTKYQADLKEHTRQHYEIKMYKCGICNRRFKTKESLMLHMQNAHALVGGKDSQEHSTTDYWNTLIKIEQPSSHDENKIFKCSLCVFPVEFKESLRSHMKSKHLKQFNYHKCTSCKYITNTKRCLVRHIKSKHLNIFEFKCNSCEFRTNDRCNLKRHIKTKHLKQFDFKCDSCEFGTNTKCILRQHVKSKHLKQFDFKCDSCEFRTNRKYHLEVHIENKHLKEFNYHKCDSCKYVTNTKRCLERHIKSKHLKEFEFKCNSCEFRTNDRCNLERHIKTKHLREFDFKCDSCEFGTNTKNVLIQHIKSKHLKQFDFKCDSCEFRTNKKYHLEVHIKTKHLEQFDLKCDKCEFRTNRKCDLKNHIKTKHLKQFNYHKCDSCKYITSRKRCLERHIKSKHLKQFEFKCNSCEFRTNDKCHLEKHVKTKHLREFDYKCDSCDFVTNTKYTLIEHRNSKHLKQFDFKCDSCEFRTNRKTNLKRHMKTKHLKEFDFKCDSCEFRTNHKSSLKEHVKAKHLMI